MAADLSNNPFAALDALRATLPDGAGPDTGDTATAEPHIAATQVLAVFYERKGRGGKEATIIVCPDSMSAADTEALAAKLKRTLGTGGSCRGGEILLQGDRRKPLRDILEKLGFKVRL